MPKQVQPPSPGRYDSPLVLVVDDDRSICEVVEELLTDEGYAVACLNDSTPEALHETVERLEPDCLLLDSSRIATDYGQSWEEARWLRMRERPVPVIMFTGHSAAIGEARVRQTERSRAAVFAGLVLKPFALDELLETVSKAIAVSATSSAHSANDPEAPR
ncbi:MAG: response regulator [Dehalococcoidia bacterium]